MNWAVGACLAVLVLIVFGQAGGHPFLFWDDQDTLSQNPNFLQPTGEKILHYWTSPPSETYYYNPVTQTVWGMIAMVAPDDSSDVPRLQPGYFHLANILVHALSVLTLYTLLLLLLEHNWLAAGIGAALFAIHPLQVEPVAWASGMKDLLCGLFGLLAVWQYARLSANPQERQGGARWILRYLLATVCFLLALFSKPAGVVVPLMAALPVLLLLRKPLARVALEMTPWLVVSLLFGFFTRRFVHAPGVIKPALWQRPLIAGDAICFYLYKLVWPWGLAPDYGHRPQDVLGHWTVYLLWLVPAALLGAVVALWKRRPVFALGYGWFLIALLPVLGLVPFDFQYYSTVSDHYLYLSMAGVALVVGWIIHRWGVSRVTTVASALLLLLAVRSMLQLRYWQGDLDLWTRTVEVNPRSFAGYTQLGDAYFRAGKIEAATDAYQRAIELNTNHPQSHNIWLCYIRKNDLPHAIAEVRAAIAAWERMGARGDSGPLNLVLGEMLINSNKPQEALVALEKAQQIQPDLPNLQRDLAAARQRLGAPVRQ